MAGRGEGWRPCDRAVRPSFVQGIGAVRGRGGLGFGGPRVSTQTGSKGWAGERCVDAEGHCPGGRTDGQKRTHGRTDGRTEQGSLAAPGRAPRSAVPFALRAAAVASRGLWGEPCGNAGCGAGICSRGSGPRWSQCVRSPRAGRRPLPLRQVFVQRPLAGGRGGGWVLGPEIPQHRPTGQ